MSRCRTLAVLSILSSSLGCAVNATAGASDAFTARVTPGLANVPWISGSTATNDERIPDVVSNGLDACGRDFKGGRLWRQWPPCPAVEPTVWGTSRPRPEPISTTSSSQELNQPWLTFIDFDWPCSPANRTAGRGSVIVCRGAER